MDLVSAYSKRFDLLLDLHRTAQQLETADDGTGSRSIRSTGRAGRPHSLKDRLTETSVQKIILSFQGGTTRKKIAEQHGISVSSVGRLLREWRSG